MFGQTKYYDEELERNVGFGWLPPFPDSRDYTTEHPRIKAFEDKLMTNTEKALKLPDLVDVSDKFPTVKDQGNLGSCTANAAAGVIEYYQNCAFEDYESPSRLFIYKTTRNLLGLTGDTGAYLRSTMASLVYFGAPPESYWRYRTNKFEKEPTSFVYGLADNYEALTYFSHDPFGEGKEYTAVLDSVKTYLAAGIPSMFGFYVFNSMGRGRDKNKIRNSSLLPFPSRKDRCVGGHAVVAVGYDDLMEIRRYSNSDESYTKGAIKFLNSWGKSWGDVGYGWLPYEYVLKGYALDFWSLMSMGWVEKGQFGL